MTDLQLVIFDCDGVLVDSEVIANEVLARALSAEGLPTTLTDARRDYQGLLLAEIVCKAQTRLDRPLPENWLARYERLRGEAFQRDLRPVASAAEVVQRITAAGVAVCVASQGKLEKTTLSLSLCGLDRLFSGEALFSAYSVPRGKPYPDLFLHAARVMGAEPSSCAVVEDSPSGLAAAISAGMRAFGYVADSDELAMRRAGAEVLRSLEELPRLLGAQLLWLISPSCDRESVARRSRSSVLRSPRRSSRASWMTAIAARSAIGGVARWGNRQFTRRNSLTLSGSNPRERTGRHPSTQARCSAVKLATSVESAIVLACVRSCSPLASRPVSASLSSPEVSRRVLVIFR